MARLKQSLADKAAATWPQTLIDPMVMQQI
jgi:hypothetical protein